MIRFVGDLGNSRLKWGWLDETGRLVEAIALPLEEPTAWDATWNQWSRRDPGPSSWAISSVNPPAADRLEQFLKTRGAGSVCWLRSAADVPVRHSLDQPETTGADRALAVSAAVRLMPQARPGLVVSCGTAITVERITAQGIWQGGAIATGLRLAAQALHLLTAQLPLVEVRHAPPAWGSSTRPALESGVYWGVVGAVRELLTRQADDLHGDPWVVWTGGDAALLAGPIAGSEARIEPDLVLIGLSHLHHFTPP
ncbi:MAG: type III pantothenate kinase [Isosphaerales bacterium]